VKKGIPPHPPPNPPPPPTTHRLEKKTTQQDTEPQKKGREIARTTDAKENEKDARKGSDVKLRRPVVGEKKLKSAGERALN